MRLGLLLLTCALTMVACVAPPQDTGKASDLNRHRVDEPIPLAEVRERGIQGRLGVPLGTIVHLKGEAVANRSQAKVHASVPFFLKITRVDDRSLEAPILFPHYPSRMTVGQSLTLGDHFHIVAYESGGYTGAPDGLFKYTRSFATTGYFFETHLNVVKNLNSTQREPTTGPWAE